MLPGEERGELCWENPVDEPLSSGKDASSQQLRTTYRAHSLSVLILSIYGKLFFRSLADFTLLFLISSKTIIPLHNKFPANWQGMKSCRLSLPPLCGKDLQGAFAPWGR